MLGKTISIRKVNGRVIVTNRPKRTLGKLTDKQERVREKFLDATQYATRQMDDDAYRALYEGGITPKKRTSYVVALTDYLMAPKVRSIDTLGYNGAVGSAIKIDAVDDFMVTQVKVSITDAAGNLVERGNAVADPLGTRHWLYEATVQNPTLAGTTIQVVAYDRPGNRGTAEVVL